MKNTFNLDVFNIRPLSNVEECTPNTYECNYYCEISNEFKENIMEAILDSKAAKEAYPHGIPTDLIDQVTGDLVECVNALRILNIKRGSGIYTVDILEKLIKRYIQENATPQA